MLNSVNLSNNNMSSVPAFTGYKKSLIKIMNGNPTIRDVETVLKRLATEIRQNGTSHTIYKLPNGATCNLAIHGDILKSYQKKDVQKSVRLALAA